MTLRTLMQAGPAKANDLFTRLAETSDGAVKTREKLFAELTAALEAHTELEEQHLFPILRKHAETKELVASAIRENKQLRADLAELNAIPKNDETFLAKLSELRKAFRQHARDETKGLLPAVQKALSEEQVQEITEKMETSVAGAEQAKRDQAEARRDLAQERAQGESRAQHEAAAEHVHQDVPHSTREAASQASEQVNHMVEVASESAREITRGVTERAQRALGASAPPLTTGFLIWDMWLGMSGLSPSRSIRTRNADDAIAPAPLVMSDKEQVIPLAEEILTVGTRKVTSGTTRVRRYVVETPVEKQVTLVRERVVVERRRPVTDKVSGEMLTELTVEAVETDEVPVMGKTVRLKEEVVVRRERIEHVETVRDTVRHDEVEIEQSGSRMPARRLRLHANA